MKILSEKQLNSIDHQGGKDIWPEFTEAMLKLEVNQGIEMDIFEWKYAIPASSAFFNSRAAFRGRRFFTRHSRDRRTLYIMRKS